MRPVRALRARLGEIPKPLRGLLVVVALFGISWALIVPAWQVPDEDAHFSYVQTLVQRHERPGSGPRQFSTAQFASMRATNADAQQLGVGEPPWTHDASARWHSQARHQSQSDGGAANPASTYPPAYYAAETAGYVLAGPQATVLDHLYAARLFSVLWLLLNTAGVWLLAGELTGRRRPLQLLAAALVGLWPMVTFMSAGVNPDGLLYASWTWTLWLGTVIIRRGLTVGRGAAFAACVALALLTKATSWALVPAAVFALAIGLWRLRPSGARRMLVPAAVALAIFVIPVGAWEVGNQVSHRSAYAQVSQVTGASGGAGFSIRGFLSYVWQYYLPRVPGEQKHKLDLPVVSNYPPFNVWVGTGWASFGWVTLFFPHGVYGWFFAITVIVGLMALFKLGLLIRRYRAARVMRGAALPTAGFFALAFVCLLGGLHLTEYQLRGPVNQGRYLFPLAGLAAMAVVLAGTLVPVRLQAAARGAVLGGLVVFQFACLWLVASHYYA